MHKRYLFFIPGISSEKPALSIPIHRKSVPSTSHCTENEPKPAIKIFYNTKAVKPLFL